MSISSTSVPRSKNAAVVDDAKKVVEQTAKEVATMKVVGDKYKKLQSDMEKSKPVVLAQPPAPPRRQEKRLPSSTSSTPSPTPPGGKTPAFRFEGISPYQTSCGSGGRTSRVDPEDLDLVLTTFGDPQDVPTLVVTFEGLRDSERVYAEYLVRFDPQSGDLTGQTGRNGVPSGVWIELHHFTSRAELDHMNSVLMAISTRFFMAKISTEIRLVVTSCKDYNI